MSKTVVITGASGGIGRATVERFLAQGWRVLAGVRDPAKLANMDGVTALALDVSDGSSIEAFARLVEKQVGTNGLQALVNNAGFIVKGPVELTPLEAMTNQFMVNTVGPVYLTQQLLPVLRAGHGRIINVSATSAQVALPFFGTISASKAALESYSDALRLELKPWRMPVVIVEPGATQTAIFAKADKAAEAAFAGHGEGVVRLYEKQQQAFDAALAKQPLNKPATIAAAILRGAEARRPKARYLAGKGTVMPLIAHYLPIWLRDRALSNSLGL